MTVSFLSRYLDSYTERHWDAALRILRYLQGSADLSIVYTGGTFSSIRDSLEIYTDADFAADKTNRRSVSGTLTKLNGGPILWSSRQQRSISLSTCEAEFHSASEGAKDAIWLTALFKELKVQITPTIYIDNQASIKLIHNPMFHMRTKHIDVRYKFIRDTYQKNQIKYAYIETQKQISDILTKPLPKPAFQRLVQLLGLKQWRQPQSS